MMNLPTCTLVSFTGYTATRTVTNIYGEQVSIPESKLYCAKGDVVRVGTDSFISEEKYQGILSRIREPIVFPEDLEFPESPW